MQTHRNIIEIFRQTRPSFSIRREQIYLNTQQTWHHLCCVFTYIHSLLIEKDGSVRWNISIKFPCACPTVITSIFGKRFHFPFPYFVLFTFMVIHHPIKINVQQCFRWRQTSPAGINENATGEWFYIYLNEIDNHKGK